MEKANLRPLSLLGIPSLSKGNPENLDLSNLTPGELVVIQAALTPIGYPPLISVDFSISSAQILTSKDTPIIIIPAPGPNKVILINKLWARYIHVATAYQGNNLLRVGYVTGWYFVDISMGDPNDTFTYGPGFSLIDQNTSLGSISPATNAINQAVGLFAINSNPTTGDGTIKGSMTYTILDLS